MSSASSVNDEGYDQQGLRPLTVSSHMVASESNNFDFEMIDSDDETNDLRDLRDSLMNKRKQSIHSFKMSDIQKLNYKNSPLLNLPTEVLLQIFHHLDRRDLFSLLTVCREFSELIIEVLWFRPNMQSDSSFKKIRQIMSMPQSETHWNYRLFIKRLNLSFMTKLVDDNLLSLFIGCPKLERLTLVNCNKLSKYPISRVLENCERLQSIDLTGVTDIQDDIILTLSRNCPRLQGLYAPGCGNVSEDAIIVLLKSCPMLKRIKFNNSENITDNCILAMYESCKSLVEIDLHFCPNVTDIHLRKIFLELSQLREFRISKSPGITDKLLELLPNDFVLEKLRIIDITDCNAITDKFVEKLVKCAPRLRNVVLSKCMQITDASLRALSQLGRSLHYIHLGHCVLITDFGVTSLVRSCHRIQYIDLACCSQLTDWTLVELANLPKLRRIGLVKCGLITDNGILELVRGRGDQDCLERVHLSYCTKLTVGPIYLLLKACPRLTHLSLTGISAFLRRDITQFCRDPPPDFNEYQKSLFCVFSGNGVNQLRNHLSQTMEDRNYQLEQAENFIQNVMDNNEDAALFPLRQHLQMHLQQQLQFQQQQQQQQQQQHQQHGQQTQQNQQLQVHQQNQQLPRQLLQFLPNTHNNTNDDNRNIDIQGIMNLPFGPGGNVGMVNNGDDNINLWASQRGLGILGANNNQNEVSQREIQDINREIFRELNQGETSTPEFRGTFPRFVVTPRNEGGRERMVIGRRMGSVGSNAPHISQPAVFPADQNIPVINDDGDEDVEMQPPGLFPRNGNN